MGDNMAETRKVKVWDSFPEKILRYIRNYQPTYQEMYHALASNPDEQAKLEETLETLIDKGHIVKATKNYYALPASERS